MKIQITNFGPIKDFTFDLEKDFTILYGKNNVGKSYAIEVVYLLLKSFMEVEETFDFKVSRIRSMIFSQSSANFEKRDRKNTLSKNNGPFDLTESVKDRILEFFDPVIKTCKDSLQNTFGNLINLKNGKTVPQITLSFKFYGVVFSLTEKLKINFINFPGITLEYHEAQEAIETKDNQVIIYTSSPVLNNHGLSSNEILQEQIIFLPFNEITQRIQQLYFLPASRSGLYQGMSAFSQIVAELSKMRVGTSQSIRLPGLPEPVADYFLTLSNISGTSQSSPGFSRIAKMMERDILKGQVSFKDATKELFYQPRGTKKELPMSASSSMVSELSPVVAFLKHVLSKDKSKKGPKPMIFIEEPEAHLHPEAQAALCNVFAALIKSGIKLVITSHSNYIFNKLNNLVLDKKLSPADYAPVIFKASRMGSKGKLMDIDELGVEDENFGEVTEKLYEEREEILEKLNEEAGE